MATVQPRVLAADLRSAPVRFVFAAEKKKGCVPFRKTLVKHNMPLKSHYLLMWTSSDEMINIACVKLKRGNSDTEVLVVWFRQLV